MPTPFFSIAKFLFATIAILVLVTADASAEKHVALIVGNSNSVNVTRLDNLTNDARPRAPSSPIDGAFDFIPHAAPLAAEPSRREAGLTLSPRGDDNDDARAITDRARLQEIKERLYELNFDPETRSGKSAINVAIRDFQSVNGLPQTGEATEGLLRRLRETKHVGPWGSIVYGEDSGKWGLSWGHASRKEAVADARAKCGSSKCPIELSFYGKTCGAFAISGKQWSLMARDTIDKAKFEALDACGKSGKACNIIGAVCADGSGLPDQR